MEFLKEMAELKSNRYKISDVMRSVNVASTA